MGTNDSLNAQQIPTSGLWKFQKGLHSFLHIKPHTLTENCPSAWKESINEWPEYFREHNSWFNISVLLWKKNIKDFKESTLYRLLNFPDFLEKNEKLIKKLQWFYLITQILLEHFNF